MIKALKVLKSLVAVPWKVLEIESCMQLFPLKSCCTITTPHQTSRHTVGRELVNTEEHLRVTYLPQELENCSSGEQRSPSHPWKDRFVVSKHLLLCYAVRVGEQWRAEWQWSPAHFSTFIHIMLYTWHARSCLSNFSLFNGVLSISSALHSWASVCWSVNSQDISFFYSTFFKITPLKLSSAHLYFVIITHFLFWS